MRKIGVLAAAWVALVLALVAIHTLAPQRSGPIALTEVFEPYLLLSAVVAGGVALWEGGRVGRGLALVLVVAALIRCGPAVVSIPGPGFGATLHVMTWNLEVGLGSADRARAGIHVSRAGLVGLQELQPDAASAIDSDPSLAQRFPYRALAPDSGTRGTGLLSAHPILEEEIHRDPPFLRALVDQGMGSPVAVFVVHPFPAGIATFARVPISLDASRRDAHIAHIRSFIDQDLAAGTPVIVLGDLNTTEREPAYAEFSAGLRDAHLDAGIGPGFTWRPARLGFLPFGLLRIDYVFASDPFVVDSTFTDCSFPSDHCRLEATIHLRTQP